MKKTILSLIVALAAACSTIADQEVVDGITWTYTVKDGCAEVGAGYSTRAIPDSTTGAITIPSILGKCPVTSIGDLAFSRCGGLTSMTMPSSVTSIGDGAFSCCSGLTSVTIPSSVASIGYGAFECCTGLMSVTIPSSVTSIGGAAFCGCSALASVTIPSSVTSIGDEAFYGCSGLTSVTIPSSVKSIGDYAFYGCSGLGDGVIIVDGWVLTVNGECPSVVDIPKGTKGIAGGAFYGCSGLTSVTIPSTVTSIGSSAFDGCSGLGDGVVIVDGWVLTVNGSCPVVVDIPNGTKGIVGRVFSCISELKFVTIPSSVTSIGDGVFCCCSGLKSVTIPSGVTSIGWDEFYGCSGLTSVTIPSSVTSIGGFAFEECSGLKSVTIPSSVTSIGNRAFYGCSGLVSLTIPSSVTSIGDYAFYGCSGLTSVTIPSSVKSIGEGAFSDCDNLSTIYVQSGDEARVRKMLEDSSAIDCISSCTFKKYNPNNPPTGGDSSFDEKHTFNGLVRDGEGTMCGMIQIATAKRTLKGTVKVSGFVMLDDGKKQTLKMATVAVENRFLNLTTKAGKLGDIALTIGENGFTGTLGDKTVASEEIGEDTGVVKGTLTLSYFDGKTGKIKTKNITVGGVASGDEALGTLTVKGSPARSFSTVVE